ncbi:hypothetical protein ACW2QC_00190 [Virgibacillus sp. FSP13]
MVLVFLMFVILFMLIPLYDMTDLEEDTTVKFKGDDATVNTGGREGSVYGTVNLMKWGIVKNELQSTRCV